MTAQMGNRIYIYGTFQCLFSAPELGLWNKLGFQPPFVPQSTANWSGYISHWAVREKRLYLTDITGLVCRREPDQGAEKRPWCPVGHFGECDRNAFRLCDILKVGPGGVPATWFSGELRIPQGEVVDYMHGDWESKYERDLILDVECGEVINEKVGRQPTVASPRMRPFWKRCVSALIPGRG